jgi:FlaA1/EpsC-like NDP-sugar epimerase
MIENSIILIGDGGHCSSCIEVINSKKHYFIKGIIDVQNNLGKFVSEYPIIGTDNDIENFIIEGHNRFLISLGQIKSSCPRRRLFETVNKLGGYFPIIIAQTAFMMVL